MTETLHLIDGSGYLFRAYHGLPKLSNAAGEPTGALFGVVNMLRRLVLEEKPKFAAFVFDASGPTFRNALYSEYKANRPPMPDELRLQIEPLLQLVAALGYPVLRESGVEADDVIGTLAVQAVAAGMRVQISTGDKDLTQLVNDSVLWVNTMSNEKLDADGVKRKHGVRPDQIIDYLALVGDAVDNIPGVAKCGPKTASKWLEDYQTLDNLVAHSDKIPGKIGEYLRAAIPQLPLCQTLTTVKLDCVLALGPTDLRLKAADAALLEPLYRRYGFNQALRELGGAIGSGVVIPAVKAPDAVEKNYDLITSEAQLQTWLARLHAAPEFAFDTETTGLNPLEAELVGISFATQPGVACYLPLKHVGASTKPVPVKASKSKKMVPVDASVDLFSAQLAAPDAIAAAPSAPAPMQLDFDHVIQALKPILQNPNIGKIAHHGKYDVHILARYGIAVAGYTHDSMLASYVLNSNATQHNMDAVAKKYLDYTTIKYEDVAGKGVKQIPFAQVELEPALAYAAEDADITLRLKLAIEPALAQHAPLAEIYAQMEIPLVPVLAAMESAGILLDANELKRQSHDLGQAMAALEASAFESAGRSFSMDSPKQLGVLLFEELKLPAKQKTPSGQPSTSEDALEELLDLHPLPGMILAYRSLAKLKGTYTDTLPELADANGRVHTSFHQAVAATGRLSSSNPNLQNIPIRTPEGRKIRRAFIAPQGFVLMAADYSQIELRIMAHLSDDPGLLSAFASGADVHRATASEIFNVPLETVDNNQRRAAKAINFGLIYGMSAFGLARNLGIARDIARDYVERYFVRYPGVKRYMEATRKLAHEQGFVETTFGRRLYLPELASRNYQLRMGAERQAINAPMQGTAADIIKRAMLAVQPYLAGCEDEIRMLLQVHDELVFEVRSDCVDKYKAGIVARMSGAAELKVPLLVEVGVGLNWDEAH
jgi:DNA polymerase I